MICHISLAVALFNLVLILTVISRMERRRTTTEATDRVLESILRNPATRAPMARTERGS